MNPLAADLDHVLAHTEGLWEELRGGRLFVTGGTGWFGCWLLESFAWANDRLKLGAEVVVLTRDPAAFGRKAPHLARRKDVKLRDGGDDFTHVIHAAPVDMYATRCLFDYDCIGAKTLLVSSGAVYGRMPPRKKRFFEDNAPLWYASGCPPWLEAMKLTPYGMEKLRSEGVAKEAHIHMRRHVTIARPFTFIGPYMPLTNKFAAGAFLRDGLKGGPIRVKDGSAVRSYLYMADLCIWLWTILFKGKPCRPYNVGSEEAISIENLAVHIGRRFGLCRRNRALLSQGERYVPWTLRAREELGLRQHVSLPDAIDRTVRWYKERA